MAAAISGASPSAPSRLGRGKMFGMKKNKTPPPLTWHLINPPYSKIALRLMNTVPPPTNRTKSEKGASFVIHWSLFVTVYWTCSLTLLYCHFAWLKESRFCTQSKSSGSPLGSLTGPTGAVTLSSTLETAAFWPLLTFLNPGRRGLRS